MPIGLREVEIKAGRAIFSGHVIGRVFVFRSECANQVYRTSEVRFAQRRRAAVLIQKIARGRAVRRTIGRLKSKAAEEKIRKMREEEERRAELARAKEEQEALREKLEEQEARRGERTRCGSQSSP